MVNVGIVGLGKMGILHASVLGALPSARVVAVCDTSRIIRRFSKNALRHARIVADVGDLSPFMLDAVYVATLPSSHYPIVKRIYSEGIAPNVFVEKSLAASHREAVDMCRLAEESGGITMVGYQKRFAVTFRKAKELLEQAGDIVSFDAHAYSSDFLEAPGAAPHSVSRGGVLRDLGSHAIDLMLWYFQDLKVATVSGADSAAETGSMKDVPEDLLFAKLQTPGGAQGELRVSARMENYRLPEIALTITGSAGRLQVTEDWVELTTNDRSQRWHRHDLNDSVPFLLAEPEYCRENDAFIAAIGNGQTPGADFAAAARVEQVIDEMTGT